MHLGTTNQDEALDPLCHIVTPVGNMGYGFDEDLTAKTLERLVPTGVPTAIILDSGSTDSGPSKLALGSMTCPRSAYVKDLTKLIRLVHTFNVPLIFSSAGGDGTNEHVKEMEGIIREIASDEHYRDRRFKTICLFANIDKSVAIERLRAGRITGCGACVPELTEAEIEASPRIVAQMGPEPFIDAMEATPDFDIVIGGRAYDPAPYVGYATHQLKRRFPELAPEDVEARQGGFLHMGKIMECGGQCAWPKSAGASATVYTSGVFDVTPVTPEARCSPLSVAAHTLYENTRPDILSGPGGTLHLDDAKYEQLGDDRTTRVGGSAFISSNSQGRPYQFKLEAARVIGYRSMFMGSVKDEILIGKIDGLLELIKEYVRQQHPELSDQLWDLDFHVYGKGSSTPAGPGELFIVAEALAPTQELATSVASKARVGMIHGPYPGQKATSGNFAFGIGGLMEIETGPCPQFSVYHLMDLEQGEERLVHEDLTRKLLSQSVSIFGSEKATRPFTTSFNTPPLTNGVSETDGANQQKQQQSQKTITSDTPKTIGELARVLRSKNAGPFEITMDAMFQTERDYLLIKQSGILTREAIADALELSVEDIVWMGFFDAAWAFKVTIPRLRAGKRAAAGGFMENDVHGSQKHLGLARFKLPEQIRQSLEKA